MRADIDKFQPQAQQAINTIAPLVCARLVRLPAWFTLGQALRVADLRGVGHVLVEEKGRVRGSISRIELAAGNAGDPLARWLRRSDVSLSPDTDVATAAHLMAEANVTCLPVSRGGLLVGTVSLTDLRHPTAALSASCAA